MSFSRKQGECGSGTGLTPARVSLSQTQRIVGAPRGEKAIQGGIRGVAIKTAFSHFLPSTSYTLDVLLQLYLARDK